MEIKKYSLKELADFLKAKLHGDSNYVITGIGSLDKASPEEISFLHDLKHKQYLDTTRAGAIILKAEDLKMAKGNALVVIDPYLAYAKLTQLFIKKNASPPGIHSTVIYGKNCEIDKTATIGAYSIIGDFVKIAPQVNIGAGCVIGDNVTIGSSSKLNPRVTLYDGVILGERALIHSGVVIGADGFGMANDHGKWCKIYQLGNVVIGNDVEIGANTTIDRGALYDTVIEDGVKLDNQIQVGHNVKIGEHTAIAGCTGIAGSVTIGKHCMIAGKVGISGHLELADGVIITAMSGIEKSIKEPGIYSAAIPAMPHRVWWRILVRILQLDNLAKRLQKIEEKVGGKN